MINEKTQMTPREALDWIAGVFQEAPGSLTPETPRTSLNTWDSMGVLMLMAGMDEEFGLVMTDQEMKGMQKVGDILAVLRNHNKLDPAP